MSELYELPAGWEWKALGGITKTTSGGTPKRNEKSYWGGNIHWLKSGELNDGYITEIEEFITEDGLNKSSAKLFKKGTLLIAMYGATVGRLGILEIETSTNQAVCGILNDKNKFETKFMFYYLRGIRKQMLIDSIGGAQPNLSQTYIKNINVPLPSLREQQRIVSKLDLLFKKIDKSIALHQKNMDEADVFMGSVLNDVFGELEEKYVKIKLSNIIKIIGGGTPSKKEKSYWEDGTIKWATVGDMNVESIVDTELSITEVGLKNSSSNIIPKEAIIIATRVGLGKVCYLNSGTAINQDLKGLLPLNDELNIRFLFNYFKNIKKYIISNGTGATVKGVKLDFIKELEIPLPLLNTQQKVVKYLDEVSQKTEKIKQVQKEKMQNLIALKASILDQAFRGKL